MTDLINRYNSFTGEQNELAKKPTPELGKDKEAIKKGVFCHKCSQKVVGEAVKVALFFYHPTCFVCTTCGKDMRLANSCLNIHEKPYCDVCGKDLLQHKKL